MIDTAKIKTVICDICGEPVYKLTKHQYQILIRKRYWWFEIPWKEIDLCEDCWKCLEKKILEEENHGDQTGRGDDNT